MSSGANHGSIVVAEGIPFIILPGSTAIIAFLSGLSLIAGILFLLTLFVIWFFRNPHRTIPENTLQLISPADGKVIRIEEVSSGGDLERSFIKISIFMNVFNVHVNRIPCSGRVVSVRYSPGKFLSANLDKASALNEKNTVLIRRDDGREIIVVQIAGLIARRIVCWIKEGMEVKKGDRFGLIRFGSRVEVLLPLGSRPLVKIGEKVKAGETPIGELK